MTMVDMLADLSNRGFQATKRYVPKECAYYFTITLDGRSYSARFEYPENVSAKEKDETQREFLRMLVEGWEKAHGRHHSKFADIARRYCEHDVEVTRAVIDRLSLTIENVIHNDPATIVFWMDGTKTVVKCQPGDMYDPEKGLAMAISKKALGNQGNYCNVFKKWLPDPEPIYPNITVGDMFKQATQSIEDFVNARIKKKNETEEL